MSSLSKKSRTSIIIDDVQERIRMGELRPGARLRTYKELLEHYGVSQSVLTKALDELERQGLVERRRRSGCFVSRDALEKLSAVERVPGQAGATGGARDPETSFYNFNPSRSSAVLNVFTCDSYPDKIALWNRLIDRFRQTHRGCDVQLHWSPGGYEGEAHFRDTAFDVVHGPHALIKHLGEENFFKAEELGLGEEEKESLIPPLREYFKRVEHPVGLPMSVTLPMLFFNLDRAGSTELVEAASFVELCNRATKLAKRGLLSDETLYLGNFSRILLADGALRIGDDLSLEIGYDKLSELLAAYENMREQRICSSDPRSFKAFLHGGSTVLSRFLFFTDRLIEHADFAWRMQPFPVRGTGRIDGIPLLLSVNRNTRQLSPALDFVHFLVSTEAQREFAELGDELPARQDALFQPEIPERMHLDAETLRQLLEKTTLLSLEGTANDMLLADLDTLGDLMLFSSLSRDVVEQRIKLAYDRYRQFNARS